MEDRDGVDLEGKIFILIKTLNSSLRNRSRFPYELVMW